LRLERLFGTMQGASGRPSSRAGGEAGRRGRTTSRPDDHRARAPRGAAFWHGLRDGSLRRITTEAGFSTAAIYLFFDNKQDLLAATLSRRGDELIAVVQSVADDDGEPMEKLHRLVDETIAFFEARPRFRHVLRHLRGGEPLIGPVLEDYAEKAGQRFEDVMATIAGIIRDGQEDGDIRDGHPAALAHFYCVLVNEHILLTSTPGGVSKALTLEQLRGLIDGSLRKPQSR
jgi:AcrR family transcriptional regulator